MHSICQQIWKTQQWPQDWKRSILVPIPKKSNVKECSNYNAIALMSHASKAMFKILQVRCQQLLVSVQLLSRVWLCDPLHCSMPGLSVHHQLSEFTQTHVHWVGDAIQPSHPLSSPSPPAFNLPQHQGLFQRVSSLHQVAKALDFQLQHLSFHWIFRTDFL